MGKLKEEEGEGKRNRMGYCDGIGATKSTYRKVC